jgi:hypothetical protein
VDRFSVSVDSGFFVKDLTSAAGASSPSTMKACTSSPSGFGIDVGQFDRSRKYVSESNRSQLLGL